MKYSHICLQDFWRISGEIMKGVGLLSFTFVCLFCVYCNAVGAATTVPKTAPKIYESPPSDELDSQTQRPGWIRRALQKVGQMASSATNAVGSGTTTINKWVERLCQIMKMIMPVVSAVCQAGQFKFCPAPDSSGELGQAISQKSINFDAVD